MAALGLLVTGLCLGWGATEPPQSPPDPLPPLPCSLLGSGGVPRPLPVLLRLRFGGGEGRGDPEKPPGEDPDPENTFDVIDPRGSLAEIWGSPRSPSPPRCELSPTEPLATPPPWAPSLGSRSPPDLGGGPWWLLSLGTPGHAVTSLLRGWGPPETPALLTVSFSVATRTPELAAVAGTPLSLHCSFSAPPGPFALEWWQRHLGSGRRLLTFDSATARVPEASAAARLLLGPPGGAGGWREVSLQLQPLELSHRGSHGCSLFLPQGQLQQLLRVQVLVPPRLTLRPRTLAVAPGGASELQCQASGFFPLDVGIRWQRRAGGPRGPLLPLGDTVAENWTSGHRRGPDGTFSRSGGLRLLPARRWHHGDTYSCLLTHPALPSPRRASSRLHVAGAEGPSLEDVVGLALVASVLCCLCCCLCPDPSSQPQDPKKQQ